MTAAPAPAFRRPWLVAVVVLVVVAIDYAIVSPAGTHAHWLRLAIALGIVYGLRAALGPADIPLRWRPDAEAWRVLGKVVAVGTVVCLVGGVAVVIAAHSGLRWELHPANISHPDQYWEWFLAAVVWAPLIEEPIYRGVVHSRLRPVIGRWGAIFASGLLFWIYHWVSFGRVTSPHHGGAGLLLAWSYDRSRTLFVPVVLHAVGNLVLGTSDLVYLRYPERVLAILGW